MKAVIKVTSLLATILLFFQPCWGIDRNLEARKQSTMLAAELLIGELREATKTLPIDSLVNLSQEMNKNKEQHLKPDESHQILRKSTEATFRQWFEFEAQKVLERLNANKLEGITTWFTEEERQSLTQPPNQAIQDNINRNYQSTFDRARKQACEEQWQGLEKGFYPSEEEFDSYDKDKLHRLLLDRALKQQAEPIFEENQSRMGGDIVEPILDDAEKQREEQRQIIRQSDGGTAIIPDGIGKAINTELQDYRGKLTKEKAGKKIANKAYAVFPSVKKQIPLRAQELAREKFADALAQMKFSAKKDDIKSIISQSLASHTSRNKSWEACVNAYQARFRKASIEQYAQKATAAERPDFQRFLEAAVAKDNACKKEIEDIVKRSLEENFGLAREEFAQKQFKELFKPLADEEWQPRVNEIDSHYDKTSIIIKEPLTLPTISNKTFKSAGLLEETVKLVEEKEKKLIQEGLGAMRKQMALIDKVEPQIAEELKTIKELPSDEELANTFTKQVLARWSESPKYPKLFERVTTEIRKRAKALLPREKARRKQKEEERIQEKQEIATAKARALGEADAEGGTEQKTTPGGKGGASGGAGQGPGGGGSGEEPQKLEFMPDLIIDLDYEDGETSVEMHFLRTHLLGVKIDFLGLKESADFTFYGQATEAQLAEIEQVIDACLNYAVSNEQAEYWIVTRVFDQDISYGAVYGFRECLEQVVDKIKTDHLKVYWFDKLFAKKNKSIYKVPEKFKQKSMPVTAD